MSPWYSELPQAEEACPNGLAPTTSTTLQLALCDALAVTLLSARKFKPVDFRIYHPGARLGKHPDRRKWDVVPAPPCQLFIHTSSCAMRSWK